MDKLAFLHDLCEIGPRYGEMEMKAAKLIEKQLALLKIQFTSQPFSSIVPVIKKAELTVDGEKLPCIGSTLVSGEIPDGKYLISHSGYSGENLPYNIAYNPMTDNLCPVDHFSVPSLTVSREAVIKIMMAKKIKGMVRVEKRRIDTENILVGNRENPENLIFAHFDSIVGRGAVDNAGSVTAMMSCIAANRKLLDTGLFIFSGNEEVAYDDYKTSGYGFRVFENKYQKQLRDALKIIVMDGIGIGTPSFSVENLGWALQLRMLEEIKEKVLWMQNDQTTVLKIFHTKDDSEKNIQDRYLTEAENLLVSKLSS